MGLRQFTTCHKCKLVTIDCELIASVWLCFSCTAAQLRGLVANILLGEDHQKTIDLARECLPPTKRRSSKDHAAT